MKHGGRESRVESRGFRRVRSIARRKFLPSTLNSRSSTAAFTLVEIMVVVGIIALILAMGAPSIYRFVHKEGFRKVVGDMVDLCNNARGRAILQGKTTEIVFRTRDRTCELGGNSGQSDNHSDRSESLPPGTVQFGDDVEIRMLDVNLIEYRDAEIARVRFFPNGTSDELTLILHYVGSGGSQWCRITLEVTTGLASVDTDMSHWR